MDGVGYSSPVSELDGWGQGRAADASFGPATGAPIVNKPWAGGVSYAEAAAAPLPQLPGLGPAAMSRQCRPTPNMCSALWPKKDELQKKVGSCKKKKKKKRKR
jgi:hypothetical protein